MLAALKARVGKVLTLLFGSKSTSRKGISIPIETMPKTIDSRVNNMYRKIFSLNDLKYLSSPAYFFIIGFKP